VASTIERIDFDCPIDLMLAIISLTAPLQLQKITLLPLVYKDRVENVVINTKVEMQ